MVVCISLTGQPNHQQKKSFFYYLTQHQLFQHQLYHWCCKNTTIIDPSAKAIQGQPKREKERPLNTTTIPDVISSSFRFNQS
jgi:hypothetical protein